jgi:hypothetical protein
MNEENLHTELFENYLNESLSEAEKIDFEQKLTANSDLKLQFMLHVASVNAVSNVGKINFKKELENIHQKKIAEPNIRFKNTLKMLFYSLLLVTVGIVSYFLGKQKPVEKLIIQEKIIHDTIVKLEVVKDYDTVIVEKIIEKAPKTTSKEKKIKETTIKVVNAELKFMYKFYDGQLTLYGDYDKNKAKFVQKDGIDYLVYDKKIFKLEPTKDTRPLIEIADPGLLKIDVLGKSTLEDKFKGNAINEVPIQNSNKKVRLLIEKNNEIKDAYMYDGVYLVLYGNYSNSEIKLVKSVKESYYLIIDKTLFFEILAQPGIIQKLKPLKKKALEKAKSKIEEEEEVY